MTEIRPASSSLPSRARKLRICLSAAFVLLGLAIFIFLKVGQWLVVQDPLQKSQAIVVLSGAMPVRALEAAKLYRMGYAPQVWLTRSEEPGASLAALGIPYQGEEDYNRMILEREGVPVASVVVLPAPIQNTADEMRAIDSQLGPGGANVIVVTTKAHTRRVHALWKKLTGNRNHILVRAASGDPFDPAHWWRTTRDALDVVREVLGLLNVWAGLPLRPSA